MQGDSSDRSCAKRKEATNASVINSADGRVEYRLWYECDGMDDDNPNPNPNRVEPALMAGHGLHASAERNPENHCFPQTST